MVNVWTRSLGAKTQGQSFESYVEFINFGSELRDPSISESAGSERIIIMGFGRIAVANGLLHPSRTKSRSRNSGMLPNGRHPAADHVELTIHSPSLTHKLNRFQGPSTLSHNSFLGVLISYRVTMIMPRHARTNGRSQHKRKDLPALEPSSPHKRVKLLSDDESSASDSTTSSRAGGVAIPESTKSTKNKGFTINSEYARRFEHNKQREELHRRMYT